MWFVVISFAEYVEGYKYLSVVRLLNSVVCGFQYY